MVTAKKSTNLQAVRSSAEAIMGGSRSANLASGPAGVLWTSCWVMDRPDFWRNFGKDSKKAIITAFMKGFISEFLTVLVDA